MNGLLTLRDGRVLQWIDNGVESNTALIFHNGTTLSYDVWKSWFDRAAAQNVRAIGVNRPGVGESSPHLKRLVKDDSEDVAELISALEITNFVSVGWSGGGARALGTALIPGCKAIHTIAGISPINLDDEESTTWLTPERRALITEYLDNFQAIVRDRGANFEEDLKLTHEALYEIVQGVPNFELHKDNYLEFSRDLFNSVAPTFVHGPETDCADYLVNISPWGFSLNEVKVPVTIWHGVEDEDVLFARGEYLHKKLSQSKFIPFKDQGHITIMLEKRDEILAGAIASLE